MLSSAQLRKTGEWLAGEQLADGMIPWFRGGHADPWNHVEALMALAACGMWEHVGRGFSWLLDKQLEDGSWCTFYVPDGVVEPRRDPNVCAYVAAGAWWCYLLSGDTEILLELWPVIDKALTWCLRWQRPAGEMAWSVGPDGVPGNFGLVTASSSFQHSLRCGLRAARVLGKKRPRWETAAARVAGAVAGHVLGGGAGGGIGAGGGTGASGDACAGGGVPGDAGSGPAAPVPVFADKDRWAMDWYYPVLSGVVAGDAAALRMKSRWDGMVEDGLGVRCVADRFWVTAAETAECAMAAARAGMHREAEQLLEWTHSHMRDGSGAYWTGCAHPACARFPGGQMSTYSAAAVVIADHVLGRRSPASAVFEPAG